MMTTRTLSASAVAVVGRKQNTTDKENKEGNIFVLFFFRSFKKEATDRRKVIGRPRGLFLFFPKKKKESSAFLGSCFGAAR
jgi:hypothetical protein